MPTPLSWSYGRSTRNNLPDPITLGLTFVALCQRGCRDCRSGSRVRNPYSWMYDARISLPHNVTLKRSCPDKDWTVRVLAHMDFCPHSKCQSILSWSMHDLVAWKYFPDTSSPKQHFRLQLARTRCVYVFGDHPNDRTTTKDKILTSSTTDSHISIRARIYKEQCLVPVFKEQTVRMEDQTSMSHYDNWGERLSTAYDDCGGHQASCFEGGRLRRDCLPDQACVFLTIQ